jgi:spermidine synthase
MTELARAVMPDGGELVLSRRGGGYEIRCNGWELMSSHAHRSEAVLAQLACANLPPAPRVLIGGLGMGFSLRAALDCLPASAVVIVAELVPAIIAWNRGPLAAIANRPLDDPRVVLRCGDVCDELNGERYDAILLDIDNGPATPVYHDAPRLYGPDGLRRVFDALTPDGVLAVWSADRSPSFETALSAGACAWHPVDVPVRDGDAPCHTIYVASLSPSSRRKPGPSRRNGGRSPSLVSPPSPAPTPRSPRR